MNSFSKHIGSNTVEKENKYQSRPVMRSLLSLLLLMPALLIQSCYSSTAVKGTPVKELIKEETVVERHMKEAEKEEIAGMSAVKENSVFMEIDGIPEYRIGPLDVLEINSHVGHEVTTTTVKVNNSGKISYSFIDDLDVVGLTPSQLDVLLTERMSNYIRNPRLNILVTEFKSKSALVLGELSRIRGNIWGSKGESGEITLTGKTTLMDLIAQGGGYTVDADIKRVKVIRHAKSYEINLYDIITKADERVNVIIDDGDVIDIPELPVLGERIYVMGEVNYQGIYPLDDAQDLLAAVSLSGAFTSLAKEENTLIIRANEAGEKPLVMMADMKALLRKADLTQNIRLEDGDLVYVPGMRIGDINDWIKNTMPLLDFLRYPADFENDYFLRKYLHFDKRHYPHPDSARIRYK
jgi:polysaccharide export outer membrane protein